MSKQALGALALAVILTSGCHPSSGGGGGSASGPGPATEKQNQQVPVGAGGHGVTPGSVAEPNAAGGGAYISGEQSGTPANPGKKGKGTMSGDVREGGQER